MPKPSWWQHLFTGKSLLGATLTIYSVVVGAIQLKNDDSVFWVFAVGSLFCLWVWLSLAFDGARDERNETEAKGMQDALSGEIRSLRSENAALYCHFETAAANVMLELQNVRQQLAADKQGTPNKIVELRGVVRALPRLKGARLDVTMPGHEVPEEPMLAVNDANVGLSAEDVVLANDAAPKLTVHQLNEALSLLEDTVLKNYRIKLGTGYFKSTGFPTGNKDETETQ